MKKILLTLSLLLLLIQVFAATYYVSPTGNDSNPGTGSTNNNAWFSIAKVNEVFAANGFSPGDAILLKRGGSWNETLTVGQSGSSGLNILIGAYGSGAKPVISGFTTVTAWDSIAPNIWESTNAVSTLTTCNMVVIGGVNTPMGREPDAGEYYYFQSHSDNFHITSTDLTGTPDWSGAELAFNNANWSTKRCPITAQSGGTLTFTQPEAFTFYDDNLRFVIQNDIRTLDQQNEWYYNPTTKKLSIYSTTEPTDVKVSTVAYVVTVDSKNYITLQNIEFTGSNDRTISVSNSDIVTIDNCNINYSGAVGVYGGYTNSDNLTVTNCTFDETNDGAIGVTPYFTNATISNNTITNTGLIYGANRPKISGTNAASGLYAISAKGSGSLIEYNTIENTGYIGIGFVGNNVTVQYNYVKNYCRVNHDGGGIYTWNEDSTYSGTAVQYNIVINDTTTATGIASYEMDAGIYCDAISNGIEIRYNTVDAVSDYGIFINGGHDINVNHNNIFNCAYSVRLHYTRLYNISLTYNNFIAKNNSQYIYHFLGNEVGAIKDSIISDYNIMIKPLYNESDFIYIYGSANQTLSEWQSYSGQDANSTYGGTNMISGYTENILLNPTKLSKTFYANSDSITNVIDALSGLGVTFPLVVAPYTSKVLEGVGVKYIVPNIDGIAPVITAFTIPATSSTLTIPITLTYTGVPVSYIITETNTKPSLRTTTIWKGLTDLTYTFDTYGSKTTYCWLVDAAGNISSSSTDAITISNPFADGLLLAYDMEESADPLTDDSGNGTVATNTAVTYNAANHYTTFNGQTNTRFVLTDNDNLSFFADTCSIEIWVYPTLLTNDPFIFSKSTEFTISTSSTAATQVKLYQNGSTSTYTGVYGLNPTLNAWNQIIITYDGSLDNDKIMVYNNAGTEKSTNIGTETITNIINAPNNLTFGGSGINWFTGNIGVVRVWRDKILSSEDRTWLYNNGVQRLTSEF